MIFFYKIMEFQGFEKKYIADDIEYIENDWSNVEIDHSNVFSGWKNTYIAFKTENPRPAGAKPNLRHLEHFII